MKKISNAQLVLFFVTALVWPFCLFGQEGAQKPASGFFTRIPYGRPWIAETHSTVNKVELGFNKVDAEFDLLGEKTVFTRPMIEMHLGYEMPLFAFYKDNWGLGLTLPISFHVLEDMWGPDTAPIIDADYRFGGPRVVGFYEFSQTGFFKNISLSWLLYYHESTHLGDEIIIYRMRENFPLIRANISYEFTELQLTLNDPVIVNDDYHSFKLGLLIRLSDWGYGWFSVSDSERTQELDLKPSAYRTEYYAQYQWQRSSGFLASKKAVNVLSFELRHRLRYAYPLTKKVDGAWVTKIPEEKMELCYNLYLGYKFFPASTTANSFGIYFHVYQGVSPFGQLRNYPNYPFFGLALITDL